MTLARVTIVGLCVVNVMLSAQTERFDVVVLARRDGTLGPMLRRRAVECVPRGAAPERTNLFDAALSDRRVCGGRAGPGTLTGNGATMNNIAQGLKAALRTVRLKPDTAS